MNILRCLAVIFLLSSLPGTAFGAVSLGEWNSADAGLLTERAEVLERLGPPDGAEGSVEWYDISGDEGLSRVTLDYLDGDRVQAVHLAFRRGSVDLETLAAVIRSAFPGVSEVIADDRMAVFLGGTADGDGPLYFLALAEEPLGDSGPELISMTEAANRHYQEERTLE